MQSKTIPSSTPAPIFAEVQERLIGLSASAAGQRQLLVYLLFFVSTLVFLAHLPALSARASFLDDQQYVAKNPLVQNPSWASARRFFAEVWAPSTVRGYYQPLTMVSLMLDRFLAGPHESLRAYHRTSLLLHVANTALLAVFLYLLFGRPLIAAGVALLFGLHPMTVEQVCWIAERKTVLATFFALWSLIAYVRYTRDPKRRYYLGCVVAYVLALLSKPIVVPLPVMMILMDYWPLDRLRRKSVTEKLPLFALIAVFAVITYVSQSRTAPVYLPGHYSPWHVPLILCHNVVFYLYKVFWPVRLSAYYEFPSPMGFSHPMVLLGVLGTAILIPLLIVSRRWSRAPLTGWLIFFVMIFPAMGIVSVTPTIAANRYAYLPSIGFLMALAAMLAWIGRYRNGGRVGMRRILPVLFVLALAGMEMVPLRNYLTQWRNTVRLHEHMLALAPRSPGVHANLAVELGARGDSDGAIEHYRTSLAEDSDNSRTRYNFAILHGGVPGREEEAIEQYKQVIDNSPAFGLTAQLNLGNIYLRRDELDQAIEQYRGCIETYAKFAAGHCNLGKTLVMAGEAQEGMKHLREAVRLRPGFLPALKDLAWFLATHADAAVRDPNEALQCAERTMAITGARDVNVLDTLAAAYARDEQYGKAVETAQQALTIARRLRNDELAGDIEERLRLYEMELPYIEAPRVQLDRLVAKTKGSVE